MLYSTSELALLLIIFSLERLFFCGIFGARFHLLPCSTATNGKYTFLCDHSLHTQSLTLRCQLREHNSIRFTVIYSMGPKLEAECEEEGDHPGLGLTVKGGKFSFTSQK